MLKKTETNPKDIETRVAISLAVQRYIRALEKFEASSQDFNDACQNLRSVIGKPDRCLANVNHFMYLVTANEHGDFEVEQLDCI